MEKEKGIIIKEILKECNWYEKLVVKLFKNLTLNIYHNAREITINSISK